MSRARLLAAALAAVSLAGGLAVPAGAQGPRASLPDIETQVMCPVCGVPLSIAESPQAERERAYIRTLIVRGETTAQIKRDLVAQFGPGVLALPPAHGIDLAAYLVPAGVIASLMIGAAIMLPRWRRRSRAPAFRAGTGQPGLPALSEADAARLDRDMARIDA